MGLLARLFSNPKEITETLASARRGIDDLVYTDQEREEFAERNRELYSKLWMASVPSALSRRLIACAVVGTFCFLCVWAVMLYTAAMATVPDGTMYAVGEAASLYPMERAAEFTFRVIDVALLPLVVVIVGFYFLKQVVSEAGNLRK